MTVDPWISGSGALILLAVAKYFFTKTDRKIDATADAVTALGAQVDAKINGMEAKMVSENRSLRTDIVKMFQDICHERQDACGKLRDAKLEKVETTCKAQCNKIHSLMDDSSRRWGKQDDLNDLVKTHLAKNNVG